MGCNAMYVKDVKDCKNLQYRQDWCYGWKALSLSFQNLFQIENQLNIKAVMSKNMFVIFWASFEAFDQLFRFITIFNTFNMKVIT